MRRTPPMAAGVLAVLLAAACDEDDRMPTEVAPPGNSNATFTRLQEEVFTPQCAIPARRSPMRTGRLVRDWVASGASRD